MPFFDLTRNPNLKLGRYLHRQSTTKRVIGIVERVGVNATALLISLHAIYVLPAFSIPYGDVAPIFYNYPVLQEAVWLFHIIAAVRTIFFAVNISSRLSSSDWDLLALTPIRKFQVISTYLWTTLQSVRGWLLALGILQIFLNFAIRVEFQTALYPYEVRVVQSCFGYFELDNCLHQNFPHLPGYATGVIPLSVASVVGITLLQITACAMLGIAVGLWLRPLALAFFTATLLRFIPVVLFALYPDKSFAYGAMVARWSQYTWFALSDAGTTAVMRLALPTNFGIWHSRVLLALLAALAILLFFILLSTLASVTALRKRGVL